MSGAPAADLEQFVIFRLDESRFALPLPVVDRVIRAVAVTGLPHAPTIVVGAIDVHGEVLPVLNVRQRFHLPARRLTANDWFLIAFAGRRKVVLVVDRADGVVGLPAADIVPVREMMRDPEYFSGVVRLPDGLVLIHDLERFLSDAEARALDAVTGDSSRP